MARSVSQSYWRGFQASIKGNSAAFGYSIVVTADFAALAHFNDRPDLIEIYLFILGAVIAFSFAEAIATHFFEDQLSDEPSVVIALSSAMDMLCVGLAVGAAALIAWAGNGWWIWPVAAIASTLVYLTTLAAQMAAAEVIERRVVKKKA